MLTVPENVRDERRWVEGKPGHTGTSYFIPVTAAAPVSWALTRSSFFVAQGEVADLVTDTRHTMKWDRVLDINLPVFSFSLYIRWGSQDSLTGKAHRKNKSA